MINEQNLRPPYTPDEARKYGAKGGVESGKSKRRKKSIAETVAQTLNSKVTDKGQLALIKKSGMPKPKNPTYKDFIVASVIMKCIKRGDVNDLSKIMEIIGETPIQEDSAALKRAKEILGDIESVIE